MQWLQEQWEQSNIISGILALAIWGAVIVLSLQGRNVPELLYFGATTSLGLFMGAKVGVARGEQRAVRRLAHDTEEADRG